MSLRDQNEENKMIKKYYFSEEKMKKYATELFSFLKKSKTL